MRLGSIVPMSAGSGTSVLLEFAVPQAFAPAAFIARDRPSAALFASPYSVAWRQRTWSWP